jgi:hypothetical protein
MTQPTTPDNKWADLVLARESWRRSALAWQSWATDLLRDLGWQPPHGEVGDKAAREIIERLARRRRP